MEDQEILSGAGYTKTIRFTVEEWKAVRALMRDHDANFNATVKDALRQEAVAAGMEWPSADGLSVTRTSVAS